MITFIFQMPSRSSFMVNPVVLSPTTCILLGHGSPTSEAVRSSLLERDQYYTEVDRNASSLVSRFR